MSSNTTTPHDSNGRSISRTRAQTPPPRPTTPLRPPSRNSLRSSQTPTHGASYRGPNPIESLEPQFAEISDSMADLEANFMHLQLMHESLSRFSECFAAFLHGLKVNAFCVDFPEAPVPESFRRAKENPAYYTHGPAQNMAMGRSGMSEGPMDPDQTFLTTDTSFVENPPTSSVTSVGPQAVKPTTPRANARGARAGHTRPGTNTAGRGGAGRGRASGLARATTRGRGRARG